MAVDIVDKDVRNMALKDVETFSKLREQQQEALRKSLDRRNLPQNIRELNQIKQYRQKALGKLQSYDTQFKQAERLSKLPTRREAIARETARFNALVKKFNQTVAYADNLRDKIPYKLESGMARSILKETAKFNKRWRGTFNNIKPNFSSSRGFATYVEPPKIEEFKKQKSDPFILSRKKSVFFR